MLQIPLDKVRKLNVKKTFKRCARRSSDVVCANFDCIYHTNLFILPLNI